MSSTTDFRFSYRKRTNNVIALVIKTLNNWHPKTFFDNARKLRIVQKLYTKGDWLLYII